jgi:enhancing lycopene biosynthesis protein 2
MDKASASFNTASVDKLLTAQHCQQAATAASAAVLTVLLPMPQAGAEWAHFVPDVDNCYIILHRASDQLSDSATLDVANGCHSCLR